MAAGDTEDKFHRLTMALQVRPLCLYKAGRVVHHSVASDDGNSMVLLFGYVF